MLISAFIINKIYKANVQSIRNLAEISQKLQKDTLTLSRNLTIKGLRLVRKIATQKSISPYIVREVRPGKNIEDDEGLLNFARETGQTSWHSVSTCRMGKGPNDVVDYNLKVFGIENLRVVDSSIMPCMPSSNTNAPSIVIGEKGADIILKNAKTK